MREDRRLDEPSRPELAGGGLEGEEDGVGGRVLRPHRVIVVACDHGVVDDGHRTDRGLPRLGAPSGLGDGLGHEELVVHRVRLPRSPVWAAPLASLAEGRYASCRWRHRRHHVAATRETHQAMTRITNMLRLRADLGRGAVVIASLAAAFVVALTAPIPTLPDAGRAEVRAEVADRLPGWSVQRIDPTWENAYAVVTSCAGTRDRLPVRPRPRAAARRRVDPAAQLLCPRAPRRDLGPPPLPPLARPSPSTRRAWSAPRTSPATARTTDRIRAETDRLHIDHR